MDNQNPQKTFEILNPATIVFSNGKRITTSNYRLNDQGIQFVSDEKIVLEDEKTASKKRFYFFPWRNIDCFFTEARDADPIVDEKKNPQG